MTLLRNNTVLSPNFLKNFSKNEIGIRKNKFRNYHEVIQQDKSWRILKLSRDLFATFCEIFEPRNKMSNKLRANYENFDRIEDRKMTIIFKSLNLTNSWWPYFVGKCSKNRCRVVLGWSPRDLCPIDKNLALKLSFEQNDGFSNLFVPK